MVPPSKLRPTASFQPRGRTTSGASERRSAPPADVRPRAEINGSDREVGGYERTPGSHRGPTSASPPGRTGQSRPWVRWAQGVSAGTAALASKGLGACAEGALSAVEFGLNACKAPKLEWREIATADLPAHLRSVLAQPENAKIPEPLQGFFWCRGLTGSPERGFTAAGSQYDAESRTLIIDPSRASVWAYLPGAMSRFLGDDRRLRQLQYRCTFDSDFQHGDDVPTYAPVLGMQLKGMESDAVFKFAGRGGDETGGIVWNRVSYRNQQDFEQGKVAEDWSYRAVQVLRGDGSPTAHFSEFAAQVPRLLIQVDPSAND